VSRPPRSTRFHRSCRTSDPARLRLLERFAHALHTAINQGRYAHTFSLREKVPRRGG